MGNICIFLVLIASSLVAVVSVLFSFAQTNDVSYVFSGHVQGNDDGFGVFFHTNREEMRDVPIHFDKPIPKWLHGTLVRNGLGIFENGPRRFTHVFDGFAKLASWKFVGDGTVLFSTQFIQSEFYHDSMRYDTIAPYQLFQAVIPPFGHYERFESLMTGIDNMNINIYEVGKKREFMALSDYWNVYDIDIDKLATRGKVVPDIEHGASSPNLKQEGIGFLNILSCAHPLPEPGTDNHITFLSSVAIFPWDKNVVNLIRIKSLKQREIIASWPVDQIPYMHSLAVTQTKAILLANPYYISNACMATKAEPAACMTWYPEELATLYVVSLKSGQVTKIQIPSVYTMHHVNAYDYRHNTIVMDICSHLSPDFIGHIELATMRDPIKRNQFENGRLKRITIDLNNDNAIVENIGGDSNQGIASQLEMPVINENCRAKHYCYIYGLVFKSDNVSFSNIAVVKKDLCTNGQGDKVWRVEGSFPAEPWFVPTPNALKEDDGILLVPVMRGNERKTYLVMLEAGTMTVINEAQNPTYIPFSLHGRFFRS